MVEKTAELHRNSQASVETGPKKVLRQSMIRITEKSSSFLGQAASFGLQPPAMHWIVVILCLVQIPTSWAIQRVHMAHVFLKPAPIDLFLHDVHAWSGGLILYFALVQLLLRWTRKAPPSSESGSKFERVFASLVHAILYGLLIALPITGYAAMHFSFQVAGLHSMLSWTLLAVALVHVAAALWHHFIRRDKVLRRMIWHR